MEDFVKQHMLCALPSARTRVRIHHCSHYYSTVVPLMVLNFVVTNASVKAV